jgi:hypothetical protein
MANPTHVAMMEQALNTCDHIDANATNPEKWGVCANCVVALLTKQAREIARLTALLNEKADGMIAKDFATLEHLMVERERAVLEAAATIADQIGRIYAEKDESQGPFPGTETCAAVACAVNIAARIRAVEPGTVPT